MDKDKQFLQEAIKIAEKNVSEGGGPFGAVVVKDGEIIGRGANRVTSSNDPTAHAEVMAIRDAAKNINDFNLQGATIYINAEPCPMCLSAIYWSRLERVVYGSPKEKAAEVGFDDSYIYKQVCLPADQTKDIPITQMDVEENSKPFTAWKDKTDRIDY